MRPDPEIARDVIARLESELRFSHPNIKTVVKDAQVTLEGNLEWSYQRVRSENAARRVVGIREVVNEIKLMPRVSADEIKARIENTLKLSASLPLPLHGIRFWAARP
jgi:hypothetical protein